MKDKKEFKIVKCIITSSQATCFEVNPFCGSKLVKVDPNERDLSVLSLTKPQ